MAVNERVHVCRYSKIKPSSLKTSIKESLFDNYWFFFSFTYIDEIIQSISFRILLCSYTTFVLCATHFFISILATCYTLRVSNPCSISLDAKLGARWIKLRAAPLFSLYLFRYTDLLYSFYVHYTDSLLVLTKRDRKIYIRPGVQYKLIFN